MSLEAPGKLQVTLSGAFQEVVMYQLIRGDSRRLPLADGSVHCVVTSPPYWGLRDYGTAKWEGGEPGCDHRQAGTRAGQASTLRSDGREHVGPYEGERNLTVGYPFRDVCGKCGARRVDAQLGLEATPDEYVASMVGVFREVWRVLRHDGTVWLNIGDSYANDTKWGGSGGNPESKNYTSGLGGCVGQKAKRNTGLKPKDLCMIPARLALALQAEGWYLRSEIIWAKPNPMPESVVDRPTKSHEQVYLLSKSERYYYDAEAVREGFADARNGCPGVPSPKQGMIPGQSPHTLASKVWNAEGTASGRNLRSVWTIATESFPGAHFATYPRKLVEPCIRAGSSERGCCPRCGAPWTREVEVNLVPSGKSAKRGPVRDVFDRRSEWGKVHGSYANSTLGWRPSCSHGLDPVPCTVLDPFCGAATTLVVAEALGRRGIGVELSAAYIELARRRLERPHAVVPRPGRVEHHPLFGDAP